MSELGAWIIAALAIFAAAFATWHAVADRPFSNALFYVVAGVEAALIVSLIAGGLALRGTERDVDGLLFISYLIAWIFIPPVAVVWGISEKSRWGPTVVVIAMVTVAALAARVHQIWVTPVG